MSGPEGQEGGGSRRELRWAFQETVEEGEHRLTRSWPGLLSTGLVGGIDVSVGILALLVVEHATGMRILRLIQIGVRDISRERDRAESEKADGRQASAVGTDG